MITAVFEVGFALVIAAVLAALFDGGIRLPTQTDAIFAVIWLGLLGSGLAFLIFFRLLSRWGATRTSLVAYVMPAVGLVLGAVVLHEAIDLRIVLGTALVIAGIGFVNIQWGSLRSRSSTAVEEPR